MEGQEMQGLENTRDLVIKIRGNVAIQMGQHTTYLTAMDDGLFTVGPPHNEGEGPYPEEVLTSVPTGDARKVAIKSGYNKYLGVDAKGRVVGRAEAIGPREMWTPVYQDGETALLSATEAFVGLDEEDNVVATSAKVGLREKLVIRCGSVSTTVLHHGFTHREFKDLLAVACKESFFLFNGSAYQQCDGVQMGSPLGPTLANAFFCHFETTWLNNCPPEFKPIYYKRDKDKKDGIPTEEQGSLEDIEVNYIKKFQKFQDKKMKINADGRIELKDAKDKGKLHEALLDRRSKMKADR